jgi:bifunctional non-homologous end joining protein LigD
LVIGWVPGRSGDVGALLVGTHDAAGDLVFCGSVTSGLGRIAKRELAERLDALGIGTAPVSDMTEWGGDAMDGRAVRWVKPHLVGVVEYREFTGRRFRHPA